MDRDRACAEARLRVFFRLIRTLMSKATLSPSVTEAVILNCVDCLAGLLEKSTAQKSIAHRTPAVNFEAWLRGDASADFSTWLKHQKVAQIMSKFAPKLREGKPTREIILMARYARRWRSKVLKAKLQPLPSKIKPSSGSPVAGAWLKPLLDLAFHSSSEMSHQSAGLDLLKKLLFTKSTTSTYRPVDCLYFLLQHYVPNLSALVGNKRGSIPSDSLLINPMISLLWTLTMVDERANANAIILKRTLRLESKSTNPPGETAPMEPLTLRPLLLSKGHIVGKRDHFSIFFS